MNTQPEPDRTEGSCADCGATRCICKTIPVTHQPGCRMILAVTAAVRCEHGLTVCPKCDPCTCEKVQQETK